MYSGAKEVVKTGFNRMNLNSYTIFSLFPIQI